MTMVGSFISVFGCNAYLLFLGSLVDGESGQLCLCVLTEFDFIHI